MTANDLIERALKTVGVLAPGETATAADASDAFTILNNMIDTWATQRLTIFHTAREVFDLAAATQDYTIGPGGTFDIVRPLWIAAASIIPDKNASDAQKIELPISAALNINQWQNVAIKGTTSTFPTEFYYDKAWGGIAGALPSLASGLALISVWPVPRSSDCQLVLYAPTPLSQFTDRTSAYTFPPGYEEAMRYQLALRLAPEFGRQLSPEVVMLASECLGNIKRVNTSDAELSIDPALMSQGGRYDWRTDRYR